MSNERKIKNTLAKKLWHFCGYHEDDGQPWIKASSETDANYKAKWVDKEKELWLAFRYTHSKLGWFWNFVFVCESLIRTFFMFAPIVLTILFAANKVIDWSQPYSSLYLFGAWAVFIVNFAFLIGAPYNRQGIKWFVHRGIAKIWDSEKDVIRGFIQQAKEKGYTVVISGHSQGGGVALLCHELCWFEKIGAITYTFGGLRILFWWGIWNIKSRFKNVFRIVEPGDLVPHVPFSFMGFIHVGKRIEVGAKKCFLAPWNWEKCHTHYGDWIEEE